MQTDRPRRPGQRPLRDLISEISTAAAVKGQLFLPGGGRWLCPLTAVASQKESSEPRAFQTRFSDIVGVSPA